MAVFAAFDQDGAISEHFIGVCPVIKVGGMSFSANNIKRSLGKYLQDSSVNHSKACLHCMGTTSVNLSK